MRKRIHYILALPSAVAVLALMQAGCSPVGNDQPVVEKPTGAQAAKKQVIDEALRNRLRTTQIDR